MNYINYYLIKAHLIFIFLIFSFIIIHTNSIKAQVTKANPTSFFNVEDTVCVDEYINVVYTGNASPSANYFWDFGDAIVLSGNSQGPYIIQWSTSGMKKISLYVYDNFIYSDTTEHVIYVDKVYSGISPLGATTVCRGDTVTLFAFTCTNCNYQWFYNGVAIPDEVNPIYKATLSGEYNLITTNLNTGCSVMAQPVTITIGEKNFPIDFSGNAQFITSPPYAVAFNNLTLNSYKYNFTWVFGDGNDSLCNNTPIFYIYKYAGLYDISLIAEDKITGCRDTLTKNGYIYCINGPSNPCDLSVKIHSNINYPTCPEDTVILTAISSNALHFQWTLNGQIIPNDTNYICYATDKGYYQVLVSDNSCSVVSEPFIVNRIPVVKPIILSEGNIRSCTLDTMILFTPVLANYVTANWSNSCNSYQNYITQSGFYSVYVTDINGCVTASDPFPVNASIAEPPQICIILVDSSLNKNRIIWDTPNDISLINSFNVYKLSPVNGGYNLLASLPNYIREYVDYSSSPQVHSDIYRISVTDTCNIESLMSDFHKTTHLNVSPASPKGYSLTWDHYQGFPFYKYYIYRGFSYNNMLLLDSIAYNPLIYTYTDTTSISTPLYYMISAVKPGCPCVGGNSLKNMSGPYSQSLSNVIDNIAYIDTSLYSYGINTITLHNNNIKIYPNPSNAEIFVNISKIEYTEDVVLDMLDLQGRIMLSKQLKERVSRININNLQKGLYIIRIKSINQIYTTKLVKN